MALTRNPLIWACLIGITLASFHVRLPVIADETLKMLANAAIALGLLSAGAGVDLGALTRAGLRTFTWSLVRLIGLPALTLGIGLAIGLEGLPAGQKVEDMNRVYYSDCLQTLFESIEALLDDGLGLTMTNRPLGTEFDLDDLLRMDTPTLVTSIADGIGAGAMSPNEGRMKLNLSPVVGGESPYLQQQNFSLAALARRDAQADPFATEAPQAPEPEDDEVDESDLDDAAKSVFAAPVFRKVA
jgi:hypothetical protein